MLLPTVFSHNLFLLFFICYTRPFLVFNVPRLMGCTEILLQFSEEMRPRSRSALHWKFGVIANSRMKKKHTSLSRNKRRSFKALPGLLISEDSRFFWKKIISILWAFSVLNYVLKCRFEWILVRLDECVEFYKNIGNMFWSCQEFWRLPQPNSAIAALVLISFLFLKVTIHRWKNAVGMHFLHWYLSPRYLPGTAHLAEKCH